MNVPAWGRLAIGLTAFSTGGAFLLKGAWATAIGVTLLAALWTWGQERRSSANNNALFAAFLIVTAWGVVRDAAPGAMLVGTLAALAAWDLGALAERLDRAEHAAAVDRLRARHVVRLSAVLGLGGILGAVGMLGSLHFSLGGAIGLGIAATMGLRWLLRTTARNLN